MPGRGCAELLISCEFNYHVDDQNNKQAMKFLQILYSFDLSQHVDVVIHTNVVSPKGTLIPEGKK